TSSPTKDAQVFEANQTTILLGISEMNSKLAQMDLTIKTLASSAYCQKINNTLNMPTTHQTTLGVNQTCSKKLENILTTPSTEQSSPPTSGASQTCNQKLILYTRTTEAEFSIPLPTTDASLPITPGVSQTCRKKLKHLRTTPLKKQNPSSTTGMSQKWIKKTNKFSVSLQMAKATEKANIQEFQLPKNIQRSKQNSHLPEPSPTPVNDNLTHSLVTKTQGMGKMSPPCTAQVLSEGETYEEFLTKHLDKYSKRGNILTTGHSLSMTNFNCTEGASQTLSKKLSQNTTEGASQTLSKKLNQNTTEGASQTLPKKLNQNTAGEVPPTLTGQLNDNLELISQSDQPMKSPLPRQISPETKNF
ncbi:hypothetical protein J6590_103376, partial [Homalodisca vitripennis]